MRRIPIGLTDEQHERLRREAGLRRTSVGALVRAAVDEAYPEGRSERRTARDRAAAVFGRFGSGTSDTSARHDEALGEEPW
jgi:hypothetical protein